MDFRELEQRIRAMADRYAVQLTESDRENVEFSLRHGEYGVAFETLCTQLFEWEAHPASRDLLELREIADGMGISPPELEAWESERVGVGLSASGGGR